MIHSISSHDREVFGSLSGSSVDKFNTNCKYGVLNISLAPLLGISPLYASQADSANLFGDRLHMKEVFYLI